jgi:Rieske Fe-S protein
MESSSPESATPVEAQQRRRDFFRWLTALAGVVASVVCAVPVVGYLLKTKKTPIDWVPLGPVRDFALNETRLVTFVNPIRQPWDGMVANTGVYVRYQGKDERQQENFLVLAVNCAHLGCPVSWFPQSGLFMCPCHGGVYYATGERASGPPPTGLFRCVWRVRDDRLEVQAPHYPTLQDTLESPA